MTAGQRDDRVLSVTRWVAAVVALVLVVAGVILYFFPRDTARLWAWPMAPGMTALAVGGGYLAGAVLFLRVVREPRWHRVGLVFVAATVLTALLLVATLLHWDLFSHGHVAFWTWLVVYAVTPPLLPLLWWRNGRYDPCVVEGATVVPRWIRVVVGTVGVVQLVTAFLFFVRPDLAIDLWPWPLSPLTARTLSAFVAFIGALLAAFLVERRWSALRLHVQAATLGLVLVGLGALRAPDDFTAGATGIAVFAILLVGLVFGLVALQIAMRRASRSSPSLT